MIMMIGVIMVINGNANLNITCAHIAHMDRQVCYI